MTMKSDPDHYLDCRQPGWKLYEKLGKIRFDELNRWVTIDDDLKMVISTLST